MGFISWSASIATKRSNSYVMEILYGYNVITGAVYEREKMVYLSIQGQEFAAWFTGVDLFDEIEEFGEVMSILW